VRLLDPEEFKQNANEQDRLRAKTPPASQYSQESPEQIYELVKPSSGSASGQS
jgi:hypothetical protein